MWDKICCESLVECQCNFWFESLWYIRTAIQISVFRLFPKVAVIGLTSFCHGRAVLSKLLVLVRQVVGFLQPNRSAMAIFCSSTEGNNLTRKKQHDEKWRMQKRTVVASCTTLNTTGKCCGKLMSTVVYVIGYLSLPCYLSKTGEHTRQLHRHCGRKLRCDNRILHVLIDVSCIRYH